MNRQSSNKYTPNSLNHRNPRGQFNTYDNTPDMKATNMQREAGGFSNDMRHMKKSEGSENSDSLMKTNEMFKSKDQMLPKDKYQMAEGRNQYDYGKNSEDENQDQHQEEDMENGHYYSDSHYNSTYNYQIPSQNIGNKGYPMHSPYSQTQIGKQMSPMGQYQQSIGYSYQGMHNQGSYYYGQQGSNMPQMRGGHMKPFQGYSQGRPENNPKHSPSFRPPASYPVYPQAASQYQTGNYGTKQAQGGMAYSQKPGSPGMQGEHAFYDYHSPAGVGAQTREYRVDRFSGNMGQMEAGVDPESIQGPAGRNRLAHHSNSHVQNMKGTTNEGAKSKKSTMQANAGNGANFDAGYESSNMEYH